MQKKNFVFMMMGAIGGILFAIGMCMCLLLVLLYYWPC